MKFIQKSIVGILVIGVGAFAFIQINKNSSTLTISKDHKQALLQQESAKSKRDNIDKESYDRYQDYLNTFIGTNIKEIETELNKENWKQEGNIFTNTHNDTITIESDEYNTIISVGLKVQQITKIYNSQGQELSVEQ